MKKDSVKSLSVFLLCKNSLDILSLRSLDACHLPFRDGAFKSSCSWHVIEHLRDPEVFLRELMRVSSEIEVRCPNGAYLSCKDETKPLHLHDFSLEWFQEKLSVYQGWGFSVKWDYNQSEPLGDSCAGNEK